MVITSTVDKLHQVHSDLLKRLDDNSDEVRIAVAKTLASYARYIQHEHNVARNQV